MYKKCFFAQSPMSRESGEEDLGAYSADPVPLICNDLKDRELATINPTPIMCVIRVWPYATFIVFTSSLSGKTSGQNSLACKSSQKFVLPLISMCMEMWSLPGVVAEW
jgi:hypothetical protein